MSERGIRALSKKRRAEMVAAALTRRSELRTIPVAEFHAMPFSEQKKIQSEVDLCNRTIAFVASVRNTE